jgi:DNA-binding HxlR family transcriptional regulator
LSDQTSVEVSTLSRLVSKLAQKGLVTRARAENSHREVKIALTSKGNELVSELIPVARHLERIAISHLSSKELAGLKKTLRHIYQNLTRNPTISRNAGGIGSGKTITQGVPEGGVRGRRGPRSRVRSPSAR